ncbi:hypothetical protein [Xanthomonas sp. CFBP 7912]|uniref:hypothetical protein n=1 Tax=Xanthomonas sp. CFBP 7912 TaxID=1891621 RepID=UPI000CEE706A|nr:hypothetical protein [Xanthomonas sp. CFBP 7912]PPU32117.1 hypothetical protein XspCFBP7912_13150 [Xanthomonas sp. CFBP 7912]
MLRTCTSCTRRLPEDEFPREGNRRRGECTPCNRDLQRSRARLAPIKRDPVQIHLNNVAALWHGPVQRTHLLRNAA